MHFYKFAKKGLKLGGGTLCGLSVLILIQIKNLFALIKIYIINKHVMYL